jgi:O-succinylbenzoic acid--CoA ligase
MAKSIDPQFKKPLNNTNTQLLMGQLTCCPVRWQAKRNSNEIAIQTEQISLNYLQLDNLVDSLANQLIDLEVGDRLVCISENTLPLILLQLTCIRLGVIFCPLNPRFSENEVNQRIEVLKSKIIYSADSPMHRKLNTLPLDFSMPNTVNFKHEEIQIDPQQVCNIIFTSGSSGQAKAVMHCFQNHFYSAFGSQSIIPIHIQNRNLLSLPLFHISGYAAVIRTLLAGATLVLSGQALTVESLKSEKITHLSLVATQLLRLLEEAEFKADKLSIEHLLLGGSAFSDTLLATTKARGFCFHLSYGLTEMSSQVASSTNNKNLIRLPNQQIKIINNEIYLRGKTRFVGYFNNDLASNLIPESQWFASKDLGSLNDKQLSISGRKDRLMISGGENIQAEEVEKVILNFPGIKQAYVVAIKDSVFGQRPVAFIDWQDQKNSSTQLQQFLQQNLSAYKRPIHYFNLPKQTTFKVSLKELQAIAEYNLKIR